MPLSRIGNFLVALIPAMVAGCAADSFESLVLAPGYFDNFDCPELAARFHAASRRVEKLTMLMEKSANDPAGPLINAIAYNTDYAKARAAQRNAEQAAQVKRCDLTKNPEPATRGAKASEPESSGPDETFGMPDWRRR